MELVHNKDSLGVRTQGRAHETDTMNLSWGRCGTSQEEAMGGEGE